ncbi:MAG TPA: DUF1858 domain-containing protein [Spirochaetes bacterium]|nr:DUF1858 domain-containing protein [Spirochaetota bacterium]
METYPRRFVLMSLIYLFIGMTIGVLTAFEIGFLQDMKFMHVHYNLLGFMVMMISGVGYHVLPRFIGVPVYFPSWIAPHFWIANVGLVLMVTGFHLKTPYPSAHGVFILGAMSSALAIAMLTINLFLTVLSGSRPKKEQEDNESPQPVPIKESQPSPPPETSKKGSWIRIDPTMKVADLVDQYPDTLNILVEDAGLKPLAMPGHLERVREIGIVLGTAILNHGGDLEAVIGKLETHVNSSPRPTDPVGPSESTNSGKIEPSMIIGDVLAMYPASRDVFLKFFGEGCFSCPGQATETVSQSAQMHGVDVDVFMEELNKHC